MKFAEIKSVVFKTKYTKPQQLICMDKMIGLAAKQITARTCDSQ
jgi:hypothetical protein